MRTSILKWALPFVALSVGIAGFAGINAMAQEPEKKRSR